ncbi:Asp23/Gls24 family envelope stress response protein [Clostridium fallax]|uniref:Uncharacterized conserved protein YloU, alkaline shock protein (Asp23) family n=1 Tax=Clostridium fallax TaxID=1533 RepID=A0A1M4XN51_9CLOT|nr:Asp23/Gls24 family envelope stress response protein [Clostridium fallax]SHE94693.1 Uncharacterized conserved protein YloU, alkaline shock protein (Asp23) family [Clostridium fallax]SQB06345.1 alkaline shock protein [Clostridium fallax]
MEGIDNGNSIGVVRISDEVVSVIAEIAASEIDGIVEIYSGVSGGLTHILTGKKASGKSVKVTVENEDAVIDMNLGVKYGIKIPEIVAQVQENVKRTVEAMTGLKVSSVNIYIQNLILPKKEEKVEVKE